jgi:acetyl-CoA carboxylase biotin carboxyl carrier protein
VSASKTPKSTEMKLSEIQDLIKFVAKSGVSEVELQTKDIKIIIKTKNAGAKGTESAVIQTNGGNVNTIASQIATPPQIQTSSPVAVSEKKVLEKDPVSDDSSYLVIKSPMIGTFYRSSGPDKAAFVNIGDEIKEGTPVCIIEAMKLFNEIESDMKGKLVKVLVNDATPVEYDQPLFLVDPL